MASLGKKAIGHVYNISVRTLKNVLENQQMATPHCGFLPLVKELAVHLPHEVATATALECSQNDAHLHVPHVLQST